MMDVDQYEKGYLYIKFDGDLPGNEIKIKLPPTCNAHSADYDVQDTASVNTKRIVKRESQDANFATSSSNSPDMSWPETRTPFSLEGRDEDNSALAGRIFHNEFANAPLTQESEIWTPPKAAIERARIPERTLYATVCATKGQRRQKKKMADLPNTLTYEREKGLEKQRNARWNRMFKNLLAYKQKYGHCDVLKREEPLGSWVQHQRLCKQMIDQGKYSSLTEERERLLASIGFRWRMEWPRSSGVSADTRSSISDCKNKATDHQSGKMSKRKVEPAGHVCFGCNKHLPREAFSDAQFSHRRDHDIASCRACNADPERWEEVNRKRQELKQGYTYK